MTKQWKEMDLESCNLKDSTGTLAATVAELNSVADHSALAALVAPSTVMAAGVESINTSVVRSGDIIKTTIVVDITGLNSSTTDLDIIGDTGICYLHQITTAVNGVIFAGQVGCAEVPGGGVTDIDLYSATEATGAFDAGIGTLTETALMSAGGAHAVGTVKPFTALPVADAYLYLTGGAGGTAAEYSAGKLVIEMWGTIS